MYDYRPGAIKSILQHGCQRRKVDIASIFDAMRALVAPGGGAWAAEASTAAAPAQPHGLSRWERRWLWLTDVPFLACAIAALAWLPAQRALSPLVCLALVAAFAVACEVRIPLSVGCAPAVQLVFVPMLFLAPLNLVPLMVLAGFLAAQVAMCLGRRKTLGRCALSLGDSWFSLGPVLVLAAAGPETFAWAYWPVYGVALAAQLAVTALCTCTRDPLLAGESQQLRDIVVYVSAVDIMLTLPALSVTAVASQAPVGAALTLATLLAIAGGFTSQRSGRLVERAHATHDPLTGLPNRLLFGELAAAASERAHRDAKPCAVMLVDLDSFKAVNDELGHETGDRVLVQAAERLRDAVHAADTVARLGGDEFAVLLGGHQTIDACERVAHKLKRAFDAPFDLPGGPRCVGLSIGAALIDGAGAFEEALHEADIAMYMNKRAQSTRFSRQHGGSSPSSAADGCRPAPA
jgi:diguanylate cyclase (GGDEF)-like protein